MGEKALQTEVDPAADQEHVDDPLAYNLIHSVQGPSKEDSELGPMNKGDHIQNSSIVPPDVVSSKQSNLHGTRTGSVTKDRRRVGGQRKSHIKLREKKLILGKVSYLKDSSYLQLSKYMLTIVKSS